MQIQFNTIEIQAPTYVQARGPPAPYKTSPSQRRKRVIEISAPHSGQRNGS